MIVLILNKCIGKLLLRTYEGAMLDGVIDDPCIPILHEAMKDDTKFPTDDIIAEQGDPDKGQLGAIYVICQRFTYPELNFSQKTSIPRAL